MLQQHKSQEHKSKQPIKGEKYQRCRKDSVTKKNVTPKPTCRRAWSASCKRTGPVRPAIALQISAGRATATYPSVSLEQQPKSANGVPVVVEACLRYFQANATSCRGLFRVPGNHDRVLKMCYYMEHHPFARASIKCVDVFMRNHPEFTAHDVAGCLKHFITSVIGNEPVITYNCYSPLVRLISNKCPAHLIGEKYKRIIGQLLVPSRRLLLGRLCNFLRDYSKYEATTQMNCASLAVCFANLMPSPPEGDGHPSKKIKKRPSTEDIMRAEAEKVKLYVSVIQILIEQSHHVFAKQLLQHISNK